MQGFLNVNKDQGMTAHDVVNRVRRLSGMKQVGHAGTLDPMACGVLPVALGRACRLLRFLQDDKVYLASILFGVGTDTDDIEGRVLQSNFKPISLDEIEPALLSFAGVIDQVPPLYSAIHVAGKRLYELARKGETPAEIPKRTVNIYKNELLDFAFVPGSEYGFDSLDTLAILRLRIHCSSGTYIRSIARDLGQMLGLPACLSALLRERVGSFELAASHKLSYLAGVKEEGSFASLVECPEAYLKLSRIELSSDESRRLCCGQRLELEQERISALDASENLLAFHREKLIAVCAFSTNSNNLQSDIVELKPLVVLDNGSAD